MLLMTRKQPSKGSRVQRLYSLGRRLSYVDPHDGYPRPEELSDYKICCNFAISMIQSKQRSKRYGAKKETVD